MKNYRIAGILLKTAFILQLFYMGVLNPASMQAFDRIAVIILLAATFLFYFFAHLVQAGKIWTKYPLLALTVLSVMSFVFGVLSKYSDWMWLTNETVIHALMITSTILVMKSKHVKENLDLSDDTILDREP